MFSLSNGSGLYALARRTHEIAELESPPMSPDRACMYMCVYTWTHNAGRAQCPIRTDPIRSDCSVYARNARARASERSTTTTTAILLSLTCTRIRRERASELVAAERRRVCRYICTEGERENVCRKSIYVRINLFCVPWNPLPYSGIVSGLFNSARGERAPRTMLKYLYASSGIR